ncbi:MAG: histidine kinase, partial [Chloroflexi bacterium]|nr:histidine kinase [Chloroflexota bacterium]
LLLDIAAFLRRTLSEEADLVPLARELEYMDAFLAIERARFGNGVRVVKRVAPEVLAVPVPSFSVQPLVDNALQHGLWPRGGRGTIWIEGERVGGRLRLTVRDDGVGIPGSPAAGNGEHCGLGLRNLRERLAACYGTDFLFEVRSRPGKGTAVTMVIPLSAAPGKWEDGLLQAAGGGG